MQIVHQSATVSYSLLPSRLPALCAPRPVLALPAPHRASLLSPGPSRPRIEVIFDRFDLSELFSGLRLRTREEMDAELDALAQESRRRLAQVAALYPLRRAR